MKCRTLWWGFVSVLLLGARAFGVEPVLAADTHVNAALPAVNSGTISNVNVGGGYTGLVQFDLSTLPSGTTSNQIARATLRLYANRVDTAGTVSVLPLGAAWSEYGVTYSTLPAMGASVGSLNVTQAGTFVTLDVTALVQGWVTTPAKNYGVALTAGTAVVQFDSKENDLTAHPAVLDVTLTSQGATGATGATGPAGPAGAVGATGATGPAGPQGIAGAAGAPGAAGAAGATGPAGVAGVAGPAGPAGAAGVAGPQGAKGLPGVGIEGAYASATNYGQNDVVTWQGSSWYSLVASNHGNTPDQSPAYWGLLAAAGVGMTGAAGPAGAVGPAGATGPQGPAGVTGAAGPTGPTGLRGLPGLVYQGAYASATNYALGDVVLWQGASWASKVDGNHGNTPDFSPGYWGVLTLQGPVGATGLTGVQGPTGATGALGPVGPPGERGDQGAQGIAGQAGAQGIPGTKGDQGLSGPAGPQGVAGPVGLSFQGVYNSATNYALADGVQYNGAGYVSLIAGNHGNTPDQSPAAWSVFAAGSVGPAGPVGATGAAGPVGPQGMAGLAGATGPQGATGAQGPAVANYTGAYSSATNYALHDAVSYAGSSWVSMGDGNHGNTPDQSPAYWALLVQKGDAGAPGSAGAPGPAGAAGVAGAVGPAGVQGPPVAFAGGWLTGHSYAVGDAVSYLGSSYIALQANTGRQPDVSPVYWGVLAAAGSAGPAGATGAQGLQGPTGYPGPTGTAGPTGATGPVGPAGAAGVAGPAGPAGVAGPQGAAGVAGLAYRGIYSSATNYGLNDGVVFGGSTWISLAASNAGNTPGSSPGYWAVLAAAGAAGPAGANGANGADGVAGAAGPAGAVGPQGPVGAAGANGSAGLVFQGAWASATNYALNDAVAYAGGSWISLVAANHGNAPDVSPGAWALLAAHGDAGPVGATGAAGAAGGAGATGPAGPQGATGATGAAGINFRGAWVTRSGYAVNDSVTFAGATYLAEVSNNSVMPGSDASVWTVLAAAGAAGPTGAAGSAATVSVGTVTTGAAGSAATVTNSGTASAAVLNFTIPQGAPGSSSGGGTGGGSGLFPYVAMYHAVSYAATYYSLSNTNQGPNETANVLTWVPQGCSATRLDVFSQQAATITVTLRVGVPGAMADTALSCSAASGTSCVGTGSVGVAAGQFVDVGITHSDSNPLGVWTALSCN